MLGWPGFRAEVSPKPELENWLDPSGSFIRVSESLHVPREATFPLSNVSRIGRRAHAEDPHARRLLDAALAMQAPRWKLRSCWRPERRGIHLFGFIPPSTSGLLEGGLGHLDLRGVLEDLPELLWHAVEVLQLRGSALMRLADDDLGDLAGILLVEVGVDQGVHLARVAHQRHLTVGELLHDRLDRFLLEDLAVLATQRPQVQRCLGEAVPDHELVQRLHQLGRAVGHEVEAHAWIALRPRLKDLAHARNLQKLLEEGVPDHLVLALVDLGNLDRVVNVGDDDETLGLHEPRRRRGIRRGPVGDDAAQLERHVGLALCHALHLRGWDLHRRDDAAVGISLHRQWDPLRLLAVGAPELGLQPPRVLAAAEDQAPEDEAGSLLVPFLGLRVDVVDLVPSLGKDLLGHLQPTLVPVLVAAEDPGLDEDLPVAPSATRGRIVRHDADGRRRVGGGPALRVLHQLVHLPLGLLQGRNKGTSDPLTLAALREALEAFLRLPTLGGRAVRESPRTSRGRGPDSLGHCEEHRSSMPGSLSANS
mmetsp:Transcript_1732/g.5111  ORF Transcript_1732/g.5111 Transcript_1732/m.5111 type:complete len:535 (+) Transcript_1732:173-1777(+)